MRWGIASTGKIGASTVAALRTVDDAEVVAVGSRTTDTARAFAERHGIERAHGSHAALVADDEVDIVYVASPHSAHHSMTIAALDAGKHVLCEKAFAVNRAQAAEMIDAARRNQRFLMEAMWSWFMPAWHEVRALIDAGEIGDVVQLDANFGLRIDDPNGRHRRPDLTGGALLDLGIYPLALARFLLGEPEDLRRDVRALGVLSATEHDGDIERWHRRGHRHTSRRHHPPSRRCVVHVLDHARRDVRPHGAHRRDHRPDRDPPAVLVPTRLHRHRRSAR
ncbi:MAG: Gfo/Idh/MocA family oxidoreductase [Actinomycetota bacterium]